MELFLGNQEETPVPDAAVGYVVGYKVIDGRVRIEGFIGNNGGDSVFLQSDRKRDDIQINKVLNYVERRQGEREIVTDVTTIPYLNNGQNYDAVVLQGMSDGNIARLHYLNTNDLRNMLFTEIDCQLEQTQGGTRVHLNIVKLFDMLTNEELPVEQSYCQFLLTDIQQGVLDEVNRMGVALQVRALYGM